MLRLGTKAMSRETVKKLPQSPVIHQAERADLPEVGASSGDRPSLLLPVRRSATMPREEDRLCWGNGTFATAWVMSRWGFLPTLCLMSFSMLGPRKSRPAHSDMIELAIESLSALENPRRTSPSRVPDLVFQTYQEVSTLRRLLQAKKVPSVSDPGSLKALLCTVVDKGKGIPKPRRAKAIDQSMTFFAELAKQAIINAESPEEKIPSGVRQIATKLAIT